MKKKKRNISIEKVKNIVIIVLILVIVFGASFMATQIGGEKASLSEKEDTNTEVVSDTLSSDASKAEEESKSISEDVQKELEEIGVDRYLEVKKDSEASVIYIARPTCHYCEIQGPIIKNIAFEHEFPIYYLNTDAMDSDDTITFTQSDDIFKEGFGTPCTIIVKDDKIVAKAEGLTDKTTLLEFFKKNDIIS